MIYVLVLMIYVYFIKFSLALTDDECVSTFETLQFVNLWSLWNGMEYYYPGDGPLLLEDCIKKTTSKLYM